MWALKASVNTQGAKSLYVLVHICLLSVLGILHYLLLVSSKLLVAPGLELFTVMLPGAPLAAQVRCPPTQALCTRAVCA